MCALFFNEKETVKFKIKKLKEVAYYNPNSKINNFSNIKNIDATINQSIEIHFIAKTTKYKID